MPFPPLVQIQCRRPRNYSARHRTDAPFPASPGAAQRFPDKVEKDPEASRALNVTATKSLAGLCAARGILLVYISTDYVFSGKEGEAPYEADATPSPPNLYGETKLDGERAVFEEYDKHPGSQGLGLTLRVPVLYGKAETPSESATNTLMDVVWKAQDGNKVNMDHWSIRYPTNTEDVGRVCHGESLSAVPFVLPIPLLLPSSFALPFHFGVIRFPMIHATHYSPLLEAQC